MICIIFYRPPNISEIRDDQLPLKKAAAIAYKESGKTVKDILLFFLFFLFVFFFFILDFLHIDLC